MNKLLPCPFCGNKNISVVVDSAEYSLGLSEEASFKVVCSKTSCGCGASSGWCNAEDEAINDWNKRITTEEDGE